VYETMRSGQTRTVDGQRVTLAPTPVEAPDRAQGERLGLPRAAKKQAPWPAECPSSVDCEVVPAAHAKYGPGPMDYGNYWTMDRPREMDIRYIVIHNTEQTYPDAIKTFQNSQSNVSAHYLVRSSDGHIAQLVQDKD